MLKLGEVKIPEDKDFEFIKSFALESKDWTVEFEKNNVKVWTRRNEVSSFNIIKIKADFNDVSASTLYNVLHDADYRSQWDDRMIEGFEICSVSLNSDIGYYSGILNLFKKVFFFQTFFLFNLKLNHQNHLKIVIL
jgi:hypothetical protein